MDNFSYKEKRLAIASYSYENLINSVFATNIIHVLGIWEAYQSLILTCDGPFLSHINIVSGDYGWYSNYRRNDQHTSYKHDKASDLLGFVHFSDLFHALGFVRVHLPGFADH